MNSESLSELDSLDPQKRELLEARLLGRVSVRESLEREKRVSVRERNKSFSKRERKRGDAN